MSRTKVPIPTGNPGGIPPSPAETDFSGLPLARKLGLEVAREAYRDLCRVANDLGWNSFRVTGHIVKWYLGEDRRGEFTTQVAAFYALNDDQASRLVYELHIRRLLGADAEQFKGPDKAFDAIFNNERFVFLAGELDKVKLTWDHQ